MTFNEEKVKKAIEELKNKSKNYDDGYINWQELAFCIIHTCHIMEVFLIESKK